MSLNFKTTIDAGGLGEMEVYTHFEYQPAEPAVYHPIDEAHPGCAEDAYITAVMTSIHDRSVNVKSYLTESALVDLSEKAIEWIDAGFNEN